MWSSAAAIKDASSAGMAKASSNTPTVPSAATDAEYVAWLDREGFPPRVVRELLRLRIQGRYAAQFKALEQRRPAVPYWRQRAVSREVDLEARAKLRALNQTITDEIKALLGPEVFHLPGDSEYENRERIYGPIAPEKIVAIEAINADYAELANQVREASRGVMFPEDREKLNYLERERHADLARLLTPDEFLQYDRRNSLSAHALRNQLRYFLPSEAEYVAMYDAQRAFDHRYGQGNLSGEQEDRRREARPELFAAMEAVLGPERFDDYRLMTDGNFGGTLRMVNSIGLPPERAKDLVRVQQEYNRRSSELKGLAGLAADVRDRQLEALGLEAREKVAAIVGAENLPAYDRAAGAWLKQISATQVRSGP